MRGSEAVVTAQGCWCRGHLRSFRDATTGPLGAAHIVLPYDVQLAEVAVADVTIDSRFNTAPTDQQPRVA